ncbi:MAG: hypothetical protein QM820_04540 [Minicystis sp.]
MNTSILVLHVVLVTVAAVGLAACHRELRIIRRGLGALDEGQGRRTASLVVGLQALQGPLGAIRASVEELSPNRRDTVEQRPSVTPPPSKAATSTGLRLELPRAAAEDRESDGETRLMAQPTATELVAAGAVRPSAVPPQVGAPDPAELAAGLGRPRGGRSAAPVRPPHPPPVKLAETVMGMPPPPGAPPQSTHRPPPPAAGRTGSGTLMSMPAQAAPSSPNAPAVTLKAVCRLCEGSGVVRMRSGALEGCGGCNGSGHIDPAGQQPAALPGEGERRAQLPG